MEKDYYFTGYNSSLCDTARMLRRNMTKQERHLWYELDGSQHYTEEGEEYDSIRTEVLERYQLEVMRFLNSEVDRNFDYVCLAIEEKVRERTGSPF